MKDTITIVQDMQKSIMVMSEVADWLVTIGKSPSKWWQPDNMNHKFLLQYTNPEEFYALLINNQPAASAVFQFDQRNQDWSSIDKLNLPALYIHWLCVSRKYAGRGLTKLMVDFANTIARKNKIKLLRVDTDASEFKLRSIYESLGFTLGGTFKEEFRETAFYQKSLA